MTAALEVGEWSAAFPGRTLPPGKTWYPLYRRLVGSRAGLDGRKISSPPGFFSIPDFPARSQSLYCLSYSVHGKLHYEAKMLSKFQENSSFSHRFLLHTKLQSIFIKQINLNSCYRVHHLSAFLEDRLHIHSFILYQCNWAIRLSITFEIVPPEAN